MIDDRQEEIAALHALDLLEGAERDQFVAELERNAELRGRVGDLRQAGAGLAHLAQTAQETEPPSRPRPSPRRPSRRGYLPRPPGPPAAAGLRKLRGPHVRRRGRFQFPHGSRGLRPPASAWPPSGPEGFTLRAGRRAPRSANRTAP